MPDPALHARVLALAGIFQAGGLVGSLARNGTVDEDAYGWSIASVLAIDVPAPDSVFGGARGVRVGLGVLLAQIDGRRPDAETTRTVVGLITREGRLRRRADVGVALRAGIEEAARAAALAPLEGPVLATRLGSLYESTIATLGTRLVIRGDERHLSVRANQARVRALLLAGVRAAALWRAQGGSRLGLLLRRARVAAHARALLAELS